MINPLNKLASVVLATFLVLLLVTDEVQAKKVGGPCSYSDYPGTIEIISVVPLPKSRWKPVAEPWQVLFTFKPSKPVSHPLYRPAKAHELTLSGGTPVGPGFIRKYGIRQGAVFKADLHLIESGTCSPEVFTLHGIDVYDHSEFNWK